MNRGKANFQESVLCLPSAVLRCYTYFWKQLKNGFRIRTSRYLLRHIRSFVEDYGTDTYQAGGGTIAQSFMAWWNTGQYFCWKCYFHGTTSCADLKAVDSPVTVYWGDICSHWHRYADIWVFAADSAACGMVGVFCAVTNNPISLWSHLSCLDLRTPYLHGDCGQLFAVRISGAFIKRRRLWYLRRENKIHR